MIVIAGNSIVHLSPILLCFCHTGSQPEIKHTDTK